MATEKSTFAVLNAINCNDKTEKKNGLTYLAWAFAWGEVKKNYPDANYTIYENRDGWNYFTDGRTCWVKTGVTINGLEHIEYLPVMNARNQSIVLEDVTSFDVNKAIQRSLTKALARHGLGLYIYAGEDLPDTADDEAREAVKARRKALQKPKPGITEHPEYVAGLSAPQYWQMVRAYGDGKTAKSGGDLREAWIVSAGPSREDIDRFDADVQDYRAAKRDGVTQ